MVDHRRRDVAALGGEVAEELGRRVRGAPDRDGRGKGARDDGRRSGRLSLNQALEGEGGRQRSLAAMKRKQERARQKAKEAKL